jgi:hypothetical protein
VVNTAAVLTGSTSLQSITITNIVMATATKQLKVSLQAAAASFTPPNAGDITYSASDVTWSQAIWSPGTGVAGTLSSAAYNEVVTCAAGPATCSTTNLVFFVAAKPTIKRAGAHTLLVTWKFESIGA